MLALAQSFCAIWSTIVYLRNGKLCDERSSWFGDYENVLYSFFLCSLQFHVFLCFIFSMFLKRKIIHDMSQEHKSRLFQWLSFSCSLFAFGAFLTIIGEQLNVKIFQYVFFKNAFLCARLFLIVQASRSINLYTRSAIC